MPRLLTMSWNGKIHAAIDYCSGKSRLSIHLGRILSERAITEAEAAEGIDRLILRYLTAPAPEDSYHGA